MPENKKIPVEQEKKEIRSMAQAVDDILGFTGGDAESADIPAEDESPAREIRSMSDAVDELRAFAGSVTEDNSEDSDGGHQKSHSDAGQRVYGDDEDRTEDDTEPRPSKHKSHQDKPKKKKGILARAFSSDKKVRDSDGSVPVTFFGRKFNFWHMFICLFVFLMLLALFLNSTNLVVDDQPVTMMALSPDAEGYRILVLSDLNGKRFGDSQSTILREIDSLDYDIVVCLGDMVGEDGDAEPFYELLEGLPKSKKVYFICGDSDPGPYRATMRNEVAPLADLVLEEWILGAVSRGAIYVDSPVEIPLDNVSIWLTPASMLNINASESLALWKEQTAQEESGYLAGIGADINSLPFTNYRFMLAESHMNACNSMEESDIHISLAHVPPSDTFIDVACDQSMADGKFLTAPDIVLAGHYCGGVWNIPLFGAFYVPDASLDRYGWFPARDRVSGLREIDDAQIYVTRGLSNSGDTPLMPFRLLNAPEISIITITATTPQSMLD